jgi:hypothetical protein
MQHHIGFGTELEKISGFLAETKQLLAAGGQNAYCGQIEERTILAFAFHDRFGWVPFGPGQNPIETCC